MPQYRYAYVDGSHEIVDVSTLSHARNDGQRTYTCVGCGEVLTAKLKGQKVAKHFAHRASVVCNQETYLHRLGKSVFHAEYRRRLLRGLAYFVELPVTNWCTRFETITGTRCSLGTNTRRFDLPQYFDRVELERRDGSFVPDLLLSSSTNPAHTVWVEIAVTHLMTSTKRGSGQRIIEIPLESEQDLGAIRSGLLTQDEARFVGFDLTEEMGVERDCSCRDDEVFFLLVYKDGRTRFAHSNLAGFEFECRSSASELIFVTHMVTDGVSDANAARLLHRELLGRAQAAGIQAMDCTMCIHARRNFELDPERPIRCAERDITCSYRRASTCKLYTPPRRPA